MTMTAERNEDLHFMSELRGDAFAMPSCIFGMIERVLAPETLHDRHGYGGRAGEPVKWRELRPKRFPGA